MPDQAPAATENTPVHPNDADTAATVLTGSDAPMTPGGGGLGARSAAPAGAGASMGTAPNAPIDVPTPAVGGGVPLADAQARAEAAQAGPSEPKHDSPSAPVTGA